MDKITILLNYFSKGEVRNFGHRAVVGNAGPHWVFRVTLWARWVVVWGMSSINKIANWLYLSITTKKAKQVPSVMFYFLCAIWNSGVHPFSPVHWSCSEGQIESLRGPHFAHLWHWASFLRDLQTLFNTFHPVLIFTKFPGTNASTVHGVRIACHQNSPTHSTVHLRQTNYYSRPSMLMPE